MKHLLIGLILLGGAVRAFYYVMGLVTGKSAYKGFPGTLGKNYFGASYQK